MHPEPREAIPASLALGDLVLVVGELQVVAAAVEVERAPQELTRHDRALDVPAGTTGPPGALPAGLARLDALPECEVGGVPQAPLGLDTGPSLHVLELAAGELAVALVSADVEVHPVLGHVGDVVVHQLLDEGDHLRHVLRAAWVVGDGLDSEVAQVAEVLLGVALGDRVPGLAGLLGAVDDLVVDVRDVVHEPHPQAPGEHPASHGVEHDGSHEVPDVTVVVDRRPADVHVDQAVLQGLQGPFLTGQAVVDADGHGGTRLRRIASSALGMLPPTSFRLTRPWNRWVHGRPLA